MEWGFFRVVSFCLYLFQPSSAFVYRVMGAVVGDGERIESALKRRDGQVGDNRVRSGKDGTAVGRMWVLGGDVRQMAMSLAANRDVVSGKSRCR